MITWIIIGVIMLLCFVWIIEAVAYIAMKSGEDYKRANDWGGIVLGIFIFIFFITIATADYSQPYDSPNQKHEVLNFIILWFVSVSIINLIKMFDKKQ